MLPSSVHDPDFWLEELDPLLKEITFAFQLAIPKAHAFFTDYVKKPINGPMLSNLIRYYALEYLQQNKLDAKDEPEPDGWYRRGLSNNGIELLYRRSCIRIRKGIEPPCPSTETAQDFYQQLLDGMGNAPGYSGIATNLLVLWNLDSNKQLEGLKLVRPTAGTSKFVAWDWMVTVPSPVLNLEQKISPEYVNPSELPLDQPSGDEIQGDNKKDKTGTDEE
jgi:hypothetical protein